MPMKRTVTVLAAALVGVGASTSAAVAETGTIQLTSSGKIQRSKQVYDCGAQGRMTVAYINGDPNFLAIVPVPGQSEALLFVSVIAGSGARYASGKYVWWTKGHSASLYDTTAGDNAPPAMTCNSSN